MIYSINMNYCTCTCKQVYSSYKMYNSICTIYMYYSIHCMYVNVLHVCTCTCIIHGMYMYYMYRYYNINKHYNNTNIHTVWTCTCTCNLYSMYSTSTCINLQSIKQMFRYGSIYPLCRMTCKKWPSIHFNWHYVWYFYKLFHSFDFHSNNEINQDNHIQRKRIPMDRRRKQGGRRAPVPPQIYIGNLYKYYNIIIVCTCTCTTIWTSNTCMYMYLSVHTLNTGA